MNSIDSSLLEENYEPITLGPEKKTIIGKITDKTDRKKQEYIRFINEEPTRKGRQNAHNVLKNKPGVSPRARSATTAKDVFDLYITPFMVEKIVGYTNKRIRNILENVKDHIMESDKYPHLKEIDSADFYAVVGLMYFRGLFCLNNHHVNLLFSDKYGPAFFSATMSRNRFKFIFQNLRFDDFATRQERWEKDRFAAMRELFESFNDNCAKNMIPEDFLSLDETLYPMRTQVGFKQYNPDKPAKYGILFKSINCARYPYTYQAHVYCGKPNSIEESHYYVCGTENYIKYLVEKLHKTVSICGRNISMDRLYTSIPIARWLLQRGITMVGTMQINRVGIPAEIKDVSQREPLSSEIYWEENGDLNISSYAVATSKGKKNVLILSTINPILGVTKDDEKKKPAIYKLYDFTKGGTDIVDQKVGTYTVKPKSRRWSISALSYILDTVRVNASTIMALNHNKDPKSFNSFDFGMELAEALVNPQIERRNKKGLQVGTLKKIGLVTGKSEACPRRSLNDMLPSSSDTPRRCRLCINDSHGKEQKVAKDKLKKVKSTCQNCGENACRVHLMQLCQGCISSI